MLFKSIFHFESYQDSSNWLPFSLNVQKMFSFTQTSVITRPENVALAWKIDKGMNDDGVYSFFFGNVARSPLGT